MNALDELQTQGLPARLPLNLVSSIFRDMLSSNVCRYRGYVLDGFPRSSDDAEALFIDKPEPQIGRGLDSVRYVVGWKAV